MTDSVGVRELRQNLSRYLDRVKQGEDLVVTERGEVVARLIPAGAAADGYLELARRFGAIVYVDTSALGRVLLGEPDAPAIEQELSAAGNSSRAVCSASSCAASRCATTNPPSPSGCSPASPSCRSTIPSCPPPRRCPPPTWRRSTRSTWPRRSASPGRPGSTRS